MSTNVGFENFAKKLNRLPNLLGLHTRRSGNLTAKKLAKPIKEACCPPSGEMTMAESVAGPSD